MSQWNWLNNSVIKGIYFAFNYTDKVWFMQNSSGGFYEWVGKDVWEYDIPSNTFTKIFTSSSATFSGDSFDSAYGMSYFNGGLYLLNHYATPPFYSSRSLVVQKLDLTSYTLSTSLIIDHIIGNYLFRGARMYNNQDELVVLRIGDESYLPDPEAVDKCYYTTNGSSWSPGTIPSSISPKFAGSGHDYAYYQWIYNRGETIRDTWCINNTYATCNNEATVKWGGGTWSLDKDWGPSGYKHWCVDPNDGRLWTNWWQDLWTTDYSVDTTLDSAIQPMFTHNFPFIIGFKTYGLSPDYEPKAWNSATNAWDDWDTMTTLFPCPCTLRPEDDSILWRNNDGECYMVSYDSFYGGYLWFKRADAIPIPPTSTKEVILQTLDASYAKTEETICQSSKVFTDSKHIYAYPVTVLGESNFVYLAGRFFYPSGSTDVIQLQYSTTGATPWTVVIDTWESDICGSLELKRIGAGQIDTWVTRVAGGGLAK